MIKTLTKIKSTSTFLKDSLFNSNLDSLPPKQRHIKTLSYLLSASLLCLPMANYILKYLPVGSLNKNLHADPILNAFFENIFNLIPAIVAASIVTTIATYDFTITNLTNKILKNDKPIYFAYFIRDYSMLMISLLFLAIISFFTISMKETENLGNNDTFNICIFILITLISILIARTTSHKGKRNFNNFKTFRKKLLAVLLQTALALIPVSLLNLYILIR